MLVDMPGYGFAYADETAVQQWTELVRPLGSVSLCMICVYVCCKRGALLGGRRVDMAGVMRWTSLMVV